MDLKLEFTKLKKGQDQILQMLSEMEIISKPGTELYSINDLAQLFKVSKRTIYNWREEGRLPFVIIGVKSYVTEDQLQRFLAENEVKPLNVRRA